MPRRRAGLKAVIAELTQGADRSSLFWWLVDHHDELAAASRGRRLQWGPLCQRFKVLGLTDRTGKPASEAAARKTWLRARKLVAEARKTTEQAPGRPFFPSRLHKDWRPEVVQPSAPARPAPASAKPPVAPALPPLPVPPLTPLVTTRSYGPKHIPDEELDLSLAPETYENEKGEIVPMPLEARQRFARMKMQLQAETEERFRFGGW